MRFAFPFNALPIFSRSIYMLFSHAHTLLLTWPASCLCADPPWRMRDISLQFNLLHKINEKLQLFVRISFTFTYILLILSVAFI